MAKLDTPSAGAAPVKRTRKPKLSVAQVLKMREDYGPPPRKSGRRPQGSVTVRALADRYKVHPDTVRDAILGKGAYRVLKTQQF
jgi:hypothetical protein